MAELIIPPSLREGHARGLARYLTTGETKILGTRLAINAMRADASEFPCELTILRVPLDGSPLFTAFLRDISEHKRTERELAKAKEELEDYARNLETTVARRTADLRATIAELESVSYSLSHDMRAPLRTIQSFSQIILAEAGNKLGPMEADLLKKSISAADRLDRLIQDVLIYSRLSQGNIELKPVEVEPLLHQVIGERPELQPPKAEIEIRGPLHPVRGHEAYLTQCITNLLDNAVKFV